MKTMTGGLVDMPEATVSANTAIVDPVSTENGTYGTKGTNHYYVVAACKHPKCVGCWEPFTDNQLLYVAGIPYCERCLQERCDRSDNDDGLNAFRGWIIGIPLGALVWLAIIGTACAWQAYLSAEQWRVFELVAMLSVLALIGYYVGRHLRRAS